VETVMENYLTVNLPTEVVNIACVFL
jgi:hypothetical protein